MAYQMLLVAAVIELKRFKRLRLSNTVGENRYSSINRRCVGGDRFNFMEPFCFPPSRAEAKTVNHCDLKPLLLLRCVYRLSSRLCDEQHGHEPVRATGFNDSLFRQ